MDQELEVITDVKYIEKLNRQLKQRLLEALPSSMPHSIGFPVGSFVTTINYSERFAGPVDAWAPQVHDKVLTNFILRGQPSSSESFNILVQLNFPAAKYNRNLSGVFLISKNGYVSVAHRGNLTKGRGKLPQKAVLSEFDRQLVEAFDGNFKAKFIYISRLDDSDLPAKIFRFAADARDAAVLISKRIAEKSEKAEYFRSQSIKLYAYELSKWFSAMGENLPTRNGVYHVTISADPDKSSAKRGFCYWNGDTWREMGGTPNEAIRNQENRQNPRIRFWQGLNKKLRPRK